MRLLLDTHAVIWWFLGAERLSRAAREAIASAGSRTWVSAVSAWEIATRHHLGKLSQADRLAREFAEMVRHEEFRALDITIGHAQTAGLLPIEHKDPFDRHLIAQSKMEGLTLVSNGALFDSFGVDRLW